MTSAEKVKAGWDNSGKSKLSLISSIIIGISGNEGNCSVRPVSIDRRGCNSICNGEVSIARKPFPLSKSSISPGSMYVNVVHY